MSKPKVSPIQQRQQPIGKAPSEGRRVSAALSSGEPIKRIFGVERLLHTDAAIDLSRAANGLPLLVNHDRSGLPIGRVEDVRLDQDAKLRGDLVFSEATEGAQNALALVREGTLTDVSISYRIDDWERGESKDEINVTRWTPLEASLVSVPADGSVGIGRSLDAPDDMEASKMPDDGKTGAGDASIVDTAIAKHRSGMDAGATAERQRLSDIRSTVTQLSRAQPHIADQLDALADEAFKDASMTADRFRAATLELLGTGVAPLNPEPRGPDAGAPRFVAPGDTRRALVVPGGDVRERTAAGIEAAMTERAGIKGQDPKELEGNQYRGWSIIDMARELLEVSGISTRGMSSEQIAKAAIAMPQSRAISPGTAQYQTSDFPAVTENVITKRVNDAYNEAEVTWNRWCSTYEVPDFKNFTIPRISNVTSLPVVAEAAQYANLTQVDAKESATLEKRGGLMSWTWEAMVNDDQGMFLRTADRMGNAAARTIDENVYGVLTANPGAGPVQGPTMGDGNQLFSAAHSNVNTLDLDLAGIVAARTAIARQTDDNSILLGIILRHIIVPEELRDAADNLAGSEYIPWVETATPQTTRINTVRGTFQVTATVRLTDTNNWYAASAAGGTIEVAFLRGNRSPALERDSGWDVDAMHFKVRHPSIAYPVDWRGLHASIVSGG